ncbi:hypothetical protein MalM25_14790 [Planctomycetes bacterium MalM25]|nr:hypothetical protein MalM25_14790 [Planctomycetes bacterium MalM25]
MTRTLLTTLFVGSLVATSTDTSAQTIAKDSYTGYTAGGLSGATSPDPIGFSGAWTSSSANLQVESGGILDGDPTNGQGKFIAAPGNFSNFSRIARHDLAPIAADPVNNTFYMSHLVNAGTSVGPNNDYALVGFGDFTAQDTIEGTANFLGGAFTGFVGNGTGGVDLVIRSRTGAAAGVISDEVLVTDAENTTYQVVMALEYNNPGDEVRYWVNPTDFKNGEAGLTASSSINGSIAGFQLGGLASMNDLTVAVYGFDRSFFWDESILAGSVMGLIPEPTSAVLAAVSLLGLAARRVR